MEEIYRKKKAREKERQFVTLIFKDSINVRKITDM